MAGRSSITRMRKDTTKESMRISTRIKGRAMRIAAVPLWCLMVDRRRIAGRGANICRTLIGMAIIGSWTGVITTWAHPRRGTTG